MRRKPTVDLEAIKKGADMPNVDDTMDSIWERQSTATVKGKGEKR